MDDSQVTLLAGRARDRWFGSVVKRGERDVRLLTIVIGFAERRFTQQASAERELLLSVAIRQIAVVADPHKALGQYLQQEAAGEIPPRARHPPGGAGLGGAPGLEPEGPP